MHCCLLTDTCDQSKQTIYCSDLIGSIYLISQEAELLVTRRSLISSLFSKDVYSLSFFPAHVVHKPTPTDACFALALLAFSFVCINIEGVNSLVANMVLCGFYQQQAVLPI